MTTGSGPPPLGLAELMQRLGDAGAPVAEPTAEALLAHYDELRRWSSRLSLIGPGTWGDAVERHYAESLIGSDLVPPGVMLDVGSGAGFPGLVLAAARSDLRPILIERRQRKAAFLRAAARRMGLDVEVRAGDLRDVLPRDGSLAVDSVVLRAVRLEPEEWDALLAATAPGAVLVLWEGVDPVDLPFALQRLDVHELAGRDSRIASYRRPSP